MFPSKVIVALLILQSGSSAMAAFAPRNEPRIVYEQPSDEDIQTALSILLEAGLIENKDGQLVIKEPSALEILKQENRVKPEKAKVSSICI